MAIKIAICSTIIFISNTNAQNLAAVTISEQAQEILEKAEKGDREAQVAIALLYKIGQDIEKSDAKALYWYEQAAKQNEPTAQNNLASIYLDGDGVEQNLDKAKYWYGQAAAQDLSVAHTISGLCITTV